MNARSIARAALVAGAALASAVAPTAGAGPEPGVPLRAPRVTTLENGLRVAVFPDARLPIVQIQLLAPAGVAAEPGSSSGVANLAAQGLLSGTTSRSASALAADLERLGGSLGASAGRDYATVSGAFLARDLDAGLELVADVVTHSIFPPDDVDRLARQAARGLIQAEQNPVATADDQLWSLVFPDHPYGRPLFGSLESLPQITADQVRAFHHDRYRPDRSVLAIAGDVTPDRALEAAREWFGGWAGRAAGGSGPAAPRSAGGARVQILDRPDLARAEIRLGAAAAARDAPDYLALALANHCFGGAPWSRLARAAPVRGSAADARSSITPLRSTGLFSIAVSAAPESAGLVVTRLRDQVARYVSSTPTEEEIDRTRRYFQKVYPLQFETLSARTSQWLAADYYGLPADFFEHYDGRVGSVSAADAAAAARHWLDPARLSVVVVGPAERLKPVLEPLGPVEVLAPPAATAAGLAEGVQPSPEQDQRGRELFRQALAAHGGAERLSHIKDSSVEGDIVLFQGENQIRGQLRQMRKDPYRMIFITSFQGLETHQVLIGDTAWSRASVDTTNIILADSLQVAGLRAGFLSDLPHLLLPGAKPGVRLAYQGRDRIAGHAADAVRADVPDFAPRRYFFDAESHRLLAIEESGPPGSGRVARRIYGDYQSVGGIQWPMSEERQVDGIRVMQLTLKKVALDSGLPDTLFAYPRPRKALPIRLKR